jgi:short-subunit dehydrogenase
MNEKYWIIGASSGIGEELARQLASTGSMVVISARSLNKLEEICAQNQQQMSAIPIDVTDENSVRDAAVAVMGSDQVPDTIVLNAGTYRPETAHNYAYSRAFDTMNVNYLGVCRVLETILPKLIERNSGKIVIVASVAGYQGLPNSLAYGPTKAALINLAEGLQIELQNTGITVQVINPGFVKTPLTARNKFKMPFLMNVEDAALAIRRGLKSHKFEIAFPATFVLILKLIRMLPYRLSLSLIRKITS